MADQTTLPAIKTLVLSPEGATQAGYASFNDCPHLAVEVPDGYFTITARTTNGKRITFAFLPHGENEPADCVDISYHDAPLPPMMNNKEACPVMHAIGFTVGYNTFDTRKPKAPTTLITVLLADQHYVPAPANGQATASTAQEK